MVIVHGNYRIKVTLIISSINRNMIHLFREIIVNSVSASCLILVLHKHVVILQCFMAAYASRLIWWRSPFSSPTLIFNFASSQHGQNNLAKEGRCTQDEEKPDQATCWECRCHRVSPHSQYEGRRTRLH